jgi:hypothetical protein
MLSLVGHQTGRSSRRIFLTPRPYPYVNIDSRGGNGTNPVRTVRLRRFNGNFFSHNCIGYNMSDTQNPTGFDMLQSLW